MRWGIFSGVLWGLDTVILAIAFSYVAFADSPHSALASAALHDGAAALILLIYMGLRGRIGDTLRAIKTKAGRAVVGAAILGGPIGMTGYLIAISNIGPGYTAIISTFYPAMGTLLAYIFLKERMGIHQIIALLFSLGLIIALSWTSSDTGASPLVGILGALACVVGWGSEAVILSWGMRDEAVDNHTALHIRQSTSALGYFLIVLPIAGALPFTAASISSMHALVIAGGALAGTVSYLFYYRAIHNIGAAPAMALNISYSAWAVIFAFLILNDVPTLGAVLCCIGILIGTVLAATPNWKDLLGVRKGNV